MCERVGDLRVSGMLKLLPHPTLVIGLRLGEELEDRGEVSSSHTRVCTPSTPLTK